MGRDKVVVVEMNSTLTSEVSPAFIIGIVKVSKSQGLDMLELVDTGNNVACALRAKPTEDRDRACLLPKIMIECSPNSINKERLLHCKATQADFIPLD